ncbi:hypothetical protein [Salinibacter ruber]|uniref:hypothetical protein n=1 Tax=Salinibacter ruber TaxID=146919 RepID=UPI002167EA17|nr:hypothetical protein [Salinibacter ruber]MCS4188534.1 hypothetical protein [Salinibacter ruber]MCS4198460.1 hypothetical protein [Salinibacter ruber]
MNLSVAEGRYHGLNPIAFRRRFRLFFIATDTTMATVIILGMALTGSGIFAWLGVKIHSLLQSNLTPEEKKRLDRVFARRSELPDPVVVGDFEEPSSEARAIIQDLGDMDPAKKREIMREVREIFKSDSQPA